MKKISCHDLGSSCRFEAQAKNLDQLIPILEDHARIKHDLRFLSLEMEYQIRDLARDGAGGLKD